MATTKELLHRTRRRAAGWQNRQRITRLARQVAAHSPTPPADRPPVVFFNVSSRLNGFSLNAAFSLLTGWAVRLAGAPVIHFACQSGMIHCVLGTNGANLDQPPPCKACIAQSNRLHASSNIAWFSYREDPNLARSLSDLTVEQLSTFEYPMGALHPSSTTLMPLGRLVLPSVRWILRRHNLLDNPPTRRLLQEYIQSAYSIAVEFADFIHRYKPQTAVIFNGHIYPEASARWVARQMGLRCVSYEVGFRQFSTFFTEGEPTAYPIHIPDDFELTTTQNAELDALLEKRFKGQFTMAGIRFWPEIRGLDQSFLEKAAQFRQVIPIFTNVIYDTSQVHANTIFPHMFAWLDSLLGIIRQHPETLFVIRAHPDEKRSGSKKLSNEPVSEWIKNNQVDTLANVIFIDSREYLSSYELIQRSKFVLVYNSSIGLEASLMGMAVVCGGKARYTQYPTAFLPGSKEDLRQVVEDLLSAEEITVPAEFKRNARRFLYYQFYRVSLPLDDFIQEGARQGYVYLKPFDWRDLLPGDNRAYFTRGDSYPRSTPATLQIIVDGILHDKPFLLPEV
jgi:hypothetical protein